MFDPLVEELRRQRALRFLVPLFFVSGLTALIYQNIWARQLQLLFGTSQFAIATVLAAFMAGLAAGGFLMARYADSASKPLFLYGALELFIGLYALVFPLLIKATTPLYLGFYAAAEPGPVLFGVFQCAALGVLLLAPTTCMGATLPLLGRFVTTRVGHVGDRIGLLYGVNTFGAVAGIAVSGFFLLPSLGLFKTTLVAAACNVLLGLAAMALSRWHGETRQPPPVEEDIEPHVPHRVPVLMVGALTGFAALVYELSWFRLMGLVLGGSTYAFSVMLLAFLTGIATGGWMGGPIADRLLQRFGPAGPLRGLAAVQAGIAVLTYLMMFVYEELPFLFLKFYDWSDGGHFWAGKVLIAALVMTPPAILMGATFPLMVRAVVADNQQLGRPVGQVYGANALGSLAGAFVGGFVLLPWLYVIGTVLVAAAANLTAALIGWTAGMHASGKIDRKAQLAWVVVALACLLMASQRPPPWDPLLMTSGVYKYASTLTAPTRKSLMAFAVDDYALLYYDEGLSTVVTVAQSKGTGNIWLANNGKVDASTTIDMPTQLLVSHLPFLFAEEPRQVLVIGLASAVTLGAVTQHEELTRIEVVELEPSIVEASHFFDDYNHRPLQDPRVRLFANDGRNHLMLAPQGSYDIVVSEPSNPWLTGVSNLFTREFFEMGRARLAPGGVWSQWVQLYGMDAEDLSSLLATFVDVFPYALLFATIEDADLVMVGSNEPLELDLERAGHLLEDNEGVRQELRLIGIEEGADLLTFYQLDRDAILEITEGVGLNTDDNMRIEYSAPLNLHRETAETNFLILLPKSEAVAVEGVEDNLALSKAYARRMEWVRALICLQRVTELQPEHAEALDLTESYRAELLEELGM